MLHSLSLDDTEDVSVGRGADVQPDAGQQVSQRSASWDVGAPADVQPLPQHLQYTVSLELNNTFVLFTDTFVFQGFRKENTYAF